MSEIRDTAGLEWSPTPVLIADAGGRIVYATNTCQELLGWSRPSCGGAGRVSGTAAPAEHTRLRERFMAEPTAGPWAWAGADRPAQVRPGGPVEIALTPVTWRAPHVLAAVRDVRCHRELVQKLSLLSVASIRLPAGVVITDRDGVSTWVNPAASRMTATPRTELVGQRPNLLKSGRHERFYASSGPR